METGTAMRVSGGDGQDLFHGPMEGSSATAPVETPWDDEGRAIEPWSLHLTGAERAHLLEALTPLTPREREVACSVCMGGANEAVADRLCIAVPTLRTHLMRINQKLGTASKGDLVRFISARLLDGYRCREIAPSASLTETSAHATSRGRRAAPSAAARITRGKSSLPMTTS